jgi:hypothetical protein
MNKRMVANMYHCGEKKSLSGTGPKVFHCPAHSLDAILIELS